MAREELITSAVTFLQDPSVSSAPLEKKVAFLQSKNLTQEEIDIALTRSGSSSPPTPASEQQSRAVVPSPAPYRASPNQGYGYGQSGQWGYAAPPELPRRDWRDWFIMATVMGGVGYGLYFVAKRYISPLIAPPTSPQLQQDKENVDEQFSRAFSLLDQLSADTAALKAAEEARTTRLDTALRDVEEVVQELKVSSRRRDDDTRRISEEVRSLKDGIPKAIEGAREGNEKRLRELNSELRSLKVLLTNRLGSSAPTLTPNNTATTSTTTRPEVNGAASGPQQTSSPAIPIPAAASIPASTPAPRERSGSPFSQLGKPASIPAWQMAAANKAKSAAASPSVEDAKEETEKAESNQQSASTAS
ncbi:peroxisomal membrane protein PEX14 [Nannizzia gypsea CBS 118893]|uniref:Peroxisomal membrane protein PEX14 n=1 Tax=Arthroderma gypseum (strain ATCC MYA-4604 / CBS 118893) TaxID=535722 RepID=E5QZP4_ARTGP|nr:peroxisomal membrane protein PEX14 [Nannizzia gypsea CBS 118893]EFQ98195.1 peroxisomal membrane protein PEX14 [Nannizzia gypsea CBS 118893]